MSININILPQGTLAIYEQIIMQLKNAIVTGELKSGEALPSTTPTCKGICSGSRGQSQHRTKSLPRT